MSTQPVYPVTGLNFTPAVVDMPSPRCSANCWPKRTHRGATCLPPAPRSEAALTWIMHICSTMWTGLLADGIPMPDEQRAEHLARRELHFGRIVNEGALYAQPFS